MATPTTVSTPKQNKGNRRTGPSRNHRTYTGRKKGQLPWPQDPEILQRLHVVLALTLQGRSAREIGQQLSLDPDTVYEDRKRIRELAHEEVLGSLTETVGRLRWVQANAEQAFLETKETSLNRSAYLNTYRMAAMDEAKLLGQEPANRLKVEGGLVVTALDATALNRPDVRASIEALYDALDGAADAAPSGAGGDGIILELPGAPAAAGAGAHRSRNGNGRTHHRDSPA